MNLVSDLMRELNISERQASGGIGAIIRLARDQLDEADYQLLARSLPERNHYVAMSAAEDYLLGAFGEVNKTGAGKGRCAVHRMAILGSRFSRLGMASLMVAEFFSVISARLKREGFAEIEDVLKKIVQ